ncbi:hypothetical protein GA0115246_103893 [Streptomyces sp. SolWspMP-sol7th]|uniref:hypothetical protein n=1 Tax=Streptomyces sp. SolWspMP-sol7th TaxID=1839776 RepID=UPI00081E13B4|nr:hypothetical protein [Streptomyces sp. SolWspMP-sol7th]SCD62297.1 hypothetical protein GA0115246_103893 [Streptomyces sp. SolWspMP-sol7th]
MSAPARRDRARAFVPDLIPEPKDLDRTGPLDAREVRDLERVHEARDHYQTARWIRGKALDAALRRGLYRGEDGQRTRQQYLDDEWDGMSETAAYREAAAWPLAREISEAWGRPAPDSHVQALTEAAEAHGLATVTQWYVELRRHGQETGRRVTAAVASNLADHLLGGEGPKVALDPLFTPRQLPPANEEVGCGPDEDRGHRTGAPAVASEPGGAER